MPEIQDINDFKNDILRLGNEPEIREQRGESIPNITVPESSPVEDLSALFDDTADELDDFDESGLFGDDADDEVSEPEFEDDFNLPEGLTEGLSDDLFEDTPEIDDEAVTGADEPEGFDDFEGLDGFDDMEEVPEIDDEAVTGADEPESFVDMEEVPGIDDEASAGADEPDSFDDMEEVPGIDDEAAAGADEPEGFDDFEGLDGFDDMEEVPEIGDEASAGADEPEGFDDFEGLDGFDDMEEVPEIDDEASAGADEPEGFDDFEGLDGFDDMEEPADTLPEERADDSGEDESEPDMFDTSELDMPDFGDSGGAGADFDLDTSEDFDSEGEDGEFSLEDFSLGEIDGDDIEASEFSLGDLGEEFGIDDEEESDIGRLEDLGDGPVETPEDFGDAYADDTYAIPDDEYVELKKTLGQMPRNLKLLIEELIGEKNLSGDNLDKLVQVLIRGASAREVGSVVSKITGKKVKIPAQYERRSAEEFEKEKATFAYAFRKNFIPMFRAASIAAILLGLVLFLGYRFVYTPLHAQSLYRRGYEEIPLGNNDQANSYFNEAFSKWRMKDWFYDYAESFTEQKQYVLAEEKYEQLLGWYPDERQAVLDYAELEFKILGKYPEAEKLLDDYLFEQIRDYDARLMLGDTYMEWAREIDTSKYEDARFNYAKLLEQFGSRDELLFRMLRYFIRTDNYDEAMNLYRAFRGNDKASVEPEIYAELAGYLIDHNHMEDVREILMKARSLDEEIPEVHYELARYFDILDIPLEEEKALKASIWLFENTSPLTRTRNGMLIDSYNRYGTVMYEQEKYLDAENYFSKAAANYDEALAAGRIRPEAKYGNIFSNLGDLSYYISGDYDQALRMFEKAELNRFSPPILKYKKGYIHYVNEDYRDALVEFYDTAGGFSVDKGLMYSTANALFNRNDYYLAEGYYTHLLDLLEKDYSSISYLLIDELPEHRALVENLMKVSNNLGVTKYRLYERTRDPEKNAEAMVLFTDSVEYYDDLARDPVSLVEPDTVNLSYLNSRSVFYPVPDYRLQIYQNIPKDLDKIYF